MVIEVSNGEIVDKITILKIKLEKINDINKLKNIKNELNLLVPLLDKIGLSNEDYLYKELYNTNLKLWDIEDKLRIMEKNKLFNDEFISLARSVYFTNDLRFELKTKINLKTSSNIVEEKSYEKYK